MSNEFNSPQLPAMGLIAGLEEDDRLFLSGYGDFLPVQEGQVLIEEGNEQKALYFVISGVLHVHTDKEDKRTLIARVQQGESLGEINIFDPGTASASVTAQSFSQVWKATREDLEAFIEAYPEAGIKLLIALVAELSRRIRHVNDKLVAVEVEHSYQNFWD
ncbi:MAG: cyclic nucleotide-binding domain-containing protein [Akkermansiaceae bacterium]|jgi:CRP/FNR family transcriptional regulator, cyclic AMP receptor protein|nr:cyclic nucleotide-binding domain-containing protein [Akkermansiaceae bacterium]